jgi:hypothetical protein
MAKDFNEADFKYSMCVNGAHLLDMLIPDELCAQLKTDIFQYYEENRRLQISSGLGAIAQWGGHHLCGKNDSIHEFLEADYVHAHLASYFDGKPYILNTISASILPPKGSPGQYEHGRKWHRDIRTFVGQGNRQLIVLMLMIDEFTPANGATEVLPGTHHAEGFPSADFISLNQRPVCGKRGSVLLFDGDVWHRAGENTTDQFRIALTCVFTRPFYKQQMDYPRFLDPAYSSTLTPRMRQLFGFDARTPATMEEWYQPAENRFYKKNQE